jgi:beta-mannosidase
LYYFVKTKELALLPPELSLQVERGREGGGLVLHVRSQALARSVRLSAGAADGHFADNYFDMLPGESRSVAWSGPVESDFSVASLWDTFA